MPVLSDIPIEIWLFFGAVPSIIFAAFALHLYKNWRERIKPVEPRVATLHVPFGSDLRKAG
jgi:hypothetical protein